MKDPKMDDAVSAVIVLISFFTTLGYDPKADKKLREWVNELSRDREFTYDVERSLENLEDLKSFFDEMLKLQPKLIGENIEAMQLQVQELRQIQQDKQARINDACVDERCEYCFRKRGQGGCMGRHTGHPSKAHKNHK